MMDEEKQEETIMTMNNVLHSGIAAGLMVEYYG